jgi:hypothetical protein
MSVNINSVPQPPSLMQQLITSINNNNLPNAIKHVVVNDELTAFAYKSEPRAYAMISLVNNNTSTPCVVNVPSLISNVNTVLSPIVELFDQPNNTRLRYTGATIIPCILHLDICVKSGTNNQSTITTIYKNGILLNTSPNLKQTCSNQLAQSGSLSHLINLSQNDYIEVYITNETASNPLTITDFSLVIKSLF